MKITCLHVEQFGLWRDFELSFDPAGLNVLLGPNEAGKSTLMRFLCGMFYGFDARGDEFQSPHQSLQSYRGGSLTVEQGGQTLTITRRSRNGEHDILAVTGTNEAAAPQELLDRLLQGTGETLFQSVFAVGLREMQQLAALQQEEVAGHVYGTSLGADGRRLLQAEELQQRRIRQLLDPDHGTGEIVELLQQDVELSAQIAEQSTARSRHEELLCRRTGIETAIRDLKSRQAGIGSQLRGHEFLGRVHPLWSHTRELQRELDESSDLEDFPDDALQQFDELTGEIEGAQHEADILLQKAAEIQRQYDEIPLDESLQAHVPAIARLLERKDLARQAAEQIEAAETRLPELREQLAAALEQLPAEWTAERLEAFDPLPEAHLQLLGIAWKYRTAQSRLETFRNRYRRLSKRCQQLLAGLNQPPHSGEESAQEHADRAREKLEALAQLSRLRARESAIIHRIESTQQQLDGLESVSTLPKWAARTMAGLAGAGGFCMVAGLVTGLATNAIGGLTILLAGATGIIIPWGLKRHHRRQHAAQRKSLTVDLQHDKDELASLHEQIAGLLPDVAGGASIPAGEITAETWQQTVGKLLEAERRAKVERRTGQMRRRLTALRVRLRELQRATGEAALAWTEQLRNLGLPETVDVTEALALWQQLLLIKKRQHELASLQQEADLHRPLLDLFRRDVWEIESCLSGGESVPETAPAGPPFGLCPFDPFVILEHRAAELKTLEQRRAERDRLQEEADSLHRQAAECQQLLSELHEQRQQLLNHAGAADREELAARAELAARRGALAEALEEAQRELEAVSQSEPELAIAEEDLLEFDPAENEHCIGVLRSERDDLESDLEIALTDLGRIEETINALERDRTSARLRYDRARLEEQLLARIEEWLAAAAAGRLLAELRRDCEQHRQPEILKAAVPHFRRMTAGRYTNIWTPLEERRLEVNSAAGETFDVSELSGGTREQLFLAIRLALAESLGAGGLELPLVLDDVIVNFDEARAAVAAEMLAEFAAAGRQVLFFTCHGHVASLFEQHGARLIRLPAAEEQPGDHHRLAG